MGLAELREKVEIVRLIASKGISKASVSTIE